ncbi:YajG family lipoprotein [Desulfocastanea catecholica]
MKNIFLLALTILLTGCAAQYPLTTNLKVPPRSQPMGIYGDSHSAALKGHDARKDSAVVIYQIKGKPQIKIPNKVAPHVLVAERLADGLQQQGLSFQSDAPVYIQLDINELVATVTRPNVLYTSTAKSRLALTIRNSEITLTKTYSRQANRDSATRPPVKDLEKLLNGQLIDIVNQILQDTEIRNAIRKI